MPVKTGWREWKSAGCHLALLALFAGNLRHAVHERQAWQLLRDGWVPDNEKLLMLQYRRALTTAGQTRKYLLKNN